MRLFNFYDAALVPFDLFKCMVTLDVIFKVLFESRWCISLTLLTVSSRLKWDGTFSKNIVNLVYRFVMTKEMPILTDPYTFFLLYVW